MRSEQEKEVEAVTTPPEGAKMKEIRQAVADYMASEGCGCCGDNGKHDKAEEKLAKLLRVPKYKDNSGFDFLKFRSKK